MRGLVVGYRLASSDQWCIAEILHRVEVNDLQKVSMYFILLIINTYKTYNCLS